VSISTNKSEPIVLLRPRLPEAEKLLPLLREIDATGIYSNGGPLLQRFQASLGGWLGRRAGLASVHVVPTSSGTAAIEVALRARAVRGRRICLMPAYTFVASAHAVCNAGLEPWLLDIEESSLALTPAIAIRALASLPEIPAAVLVVSAFGAPVDVAAWEAFEAEHGIPVVYDAAAAVTSLRKIGRQPLCVSLHATKVFGIGEGGAVITEDADLAERARAITGFGFTGTDRLSVLRGGNYRMSEYAAAIGLVVLSEIDEKIAAISELGRRYRDALVESPCRLQTGAATDWATLTLNAIVPEPLLTTVLGELDVDLIQWRRWWGFGVHTHPAFFGLRRASLAATERSAWRVIGLPFHEGLTDTAIARVARCLVARSGHSRYGLQ